MPRLCRYLFLAAFLLLITWEPLRGQTEHGDRVAGLVQEGIALHNQGRYDEAAAKYLKALELEPRSELAIYELAFAFNAASKHEDCVATAEAGIRLKGKYQPHFYTVAGNCLDEAGDSKKALKMYRRGLKKYPGHPLLAFNLAILKNHKQEYKAATKYAKLAIDNAPEHASSHRLLGEIFRENGFAIPALLATLRFLTLESRTERSQYAAHVVVALLTRGVTQNSESKISITLSSHSPKQEGDFKTAEMILALTGALRFTEEAGKETELASYVGSIDSLISVLAETAMDERETTWVWRTYIEFFIAAQRAGVLEALSYNSLSSLGLPETGEWRRENVEKLEDLAEWFKARE